MTAAAPALPRVLDAFAGEVTRLTDRHPEEAPRVAAVAERLRDLMAQPDLLPARLCRPLPERYRRNLLYKDPRNRFVIMGLVWGKGQFTPVHDHGCYSVVGVYRNRMEVTNYLRTDDGSRPGIARLQEWTHAIGGPGSVFHGVPPVDEIHAIGNPFDEPTLSIHVYGREIESVNCYDLAQHTVRRSDPLVYHNDR